MHISLGSENNHPLFQSIPPALQHIIEMQQTAALQQSLHSQRFRLQMESIVNSIEWERLNTGLEHGGVRKSQCTNSGT